MFNFFYFPLKNGTVSRSTMSSLLTGSFKYHICRMIKKNIGTRFYYQEDLKEINLSSQ